jgi:peptidylprolyl isomerase
MNRNSFAKIAMSLVLGAAVLGTSACARKQDALSKAMSQNVNKTNLSRSIPTRRLTRTTCWCSTCRTAGAC